MLGFCCLFVLIFFCFLFLSFFDIFLWRLSLVVRPQINYPFSFSFVPAFVYPPPKKRETIPIKTSYSLRQNNIEEYKFTRVSVSLNQGSRLPHVFTRSPRRHNTARQGQIMAGDATHTHTHTQIYAYTGPSTSIWSLVRECMRERRGELEWRAREESQAFFFFFLMTILMLL